MVWVRVKLSCLPAASCVTLLSELHPRVLSFDSVAILCVGLIKIISQSYHYIKLIKLPLVP